MIWLFFLLVFLISLCTLILTKIYFSSSPLRKNNKNQPYYQISLMLGSGGHTGQLTHMLQRFKFEKAERVNVIITTGDNSSKAFFQNLITYAKQNKKFNYFYIKRTNQVKQSYFSSIFTTIKAFFQAIFLIRNELINTTHFISNGPGSCVPYFVIFKFLKIIKITKITLIFIQSWCRVTSISLTGKIVRFLTDKFIVHWQQQHKKFSWTNYYGKII